MHIPHINSNAGITLPRNFIHPELAGKYEPYLSSAEWDGQPRDSVIDYVASKVKSFDGGSSLSLESGGQVLYGGRERRHKGSSIDGYDLWPREVGITFSGDDDHLCYFIILEEIFRRTSSGQVDDETVGDIVVTHMDSDGRKLVNIIYKDCVFSSIGDLRLDFREAGGDVSDFDVSLNANGVEMDRLIGKDK